MVRLSLCAVLLAVHGWISVAVAVEPQVRLVSPRGLQIGGTTIVTVVGASLGPAPRLIAPFPIGEQKVIEAAGEKVRIEVRLDPNSPAGLYPVRLANETGVSSAFMMGWDRLPQTTMEQINPSIPSGIPVAISGQLTGATIHQWTFSGTAGLSFVADVEAKRLGSKLSPVIRLLDAEGSQLAYSDSVRSLHHDARLKFTLPADGVYTVQLHDRLYRGGGPGDFRLKLGDLLAVDAVYPAAVQRGQTAQLELLGTAAGSLSIEVGADQAPPWKRVEVPGLTGAAPLVMVSDYPELLEQREEAQPQTLPAAPVAVSGKLSEARQSDVYRLPVAGAGKLRFELFADRLGSEIDGVLILKDGQGRQLARGDDQPGTPDPLVEYAPAQDAEFVDLVVEDLTRRGGADHLYRLQVTAADQPDFELTLDSDRILTPAGNRQVLPLKVRRTVYRGPIQVRVLNAPDGVVISGGEIQDGSIHGLLSFQAAAGPADAWLVHLVAEAQIGDQRVRRFASFSADDLPKLDAAAGSGIVLARTQPAPLSIDFAELTEHDQLYLGGRWDAPLILQRSEQGQGVVRLSLLTSQVIPKKKIKENDKDVVVDDMDRALRVDGPTEFGPEEPVRMTVIVPPDLAQREYDLAVRAELLAADKTTVVASVTTPLLRRRPQSPLALTLAEVEGTSRAIAGQGGEPAVLRGSICVRPA